MLTRMSRKRDQFRFEGGVGDDCYLNRCREEMIEGGERAEGQWKSLSNLVALLHISWI